MAFDFRADGRRGARLGLPLRRLCRIRATRSRRAFEWMAGGGEGMLPQEEGVWGKRLTRPPASACPFRRFGGSPIQRLGPQDLAD